MDGGLEGTKLDFSAASLLGVNSPESSVVLGAEKNFSTMMREVSENHIMG